MREYKTLKVPRAGEVIDYQGIFLKMAEGIRGSGGSMNIDKVTRFEVTDHTSKLYGWDISNGRILVRHDVSIELSFQDDGRTLKIFLRDS